MQDLQKFISSPLFGRIARWTVILTATYTFIGFLIAPLVAEFVVPRQLSEQLNRDVEIGDIDFNPYALSLSITDFLIKDRKTKEQLFSFHALYTNFQIASAFKGGIIVKEIRIDRPSVNIHRYEDSLYNFSDLIPGWEAEHVPESAPVKFSINNIQVLNGSVDFLDDPVHTRHTVRNIAVNIPMISNFPYFVDSYVQPFFSAVINGSPFMLKGKSKPFSDSLETTVELDIQGLDIPHYLAYIPFKLNFSIPKGSLNARNSISFTQYAEGPPSLFVEGDISLNNVLVVDGRDNPVLNVPSLKVSLAPSDVLLKKIHLTKVFLQSPTLHAARDASGTVNLETLLPSLSDDTRNADGGTESGQELSLRLDDVHLAGGTVQFSDGSFEKPIEAKISNIEFSGENISTAKGSKGSVSLSFNLNEKGSFSAEGPVGITPLSAEMDFTLKDIDIVPLQPYVTEKLNVLVTGGTFKTGGKVSFYSSGPGELNASFTGEAGLTSFSSVDKLNANDFLKWDALYLNGIHVGYSPLNVTIDTVAVADFYSRLIVNSDGTLNVQGIVKEEEPSAEGAVRDKGDEEQDAQEHVTPGTQTKINTVTLQAGTINFSDRHIQPNFSANMLDIGGRISGLSSEEGSQADVELRGKLENYAPLVIRGRINPLSKDLFVDLKIDFHDMDLSPLTPYAHKYAGYTIQKGRLSLDLKYQIVKKELDSDNKIFLDQFTFGDRVESPDATKLPVKFAIALLKNRKGEINLDLPVTGSIDDPEFDIGGIILKMVVNMLVKAATSPFKLIGALVGGGEELSYIEFDYGASTLSEQHKSKLDKLAKALGDRPGLNVDITGYADSEKDREALRQRTFDNKIKTQKLKEIVGRGESGVPVDEIVIAPEEYEKYLTKAYKAETFPKPKNIFGLDKKLPPPEMEKLMYTYIVISNDDLRLLASKRALAVKDYLLSAGQVAPERIFLVEPETLQPEKKEALKDSRVDFSLK